MRSMLIGAAILVGSALAANAQWTYGVPPQDAANPYFPTYQPYPYGQVPTTAPSWSYDPYTSGLGPCPQRGPGDPPCKEMVHPTFGQPSYWPQP